MEKIDWTFIQKEYDSGKSQRDLMREYGMNSHSIHKAVVRGDLKCLPQADSCRRRMRLKPPRKLTAEEREAISVRVKKLFRERPELHPNRKVANNRNVMTYPERLAYDFLKASNIDFIHNARIADYYVDFLVGSVAIEIDGEYWHRDKDYDDRRSEVIRSLGFDIIRIRAADITQDKENTLLKAATAGRIDNEAVELFRQRELERVTAKAEVEAANRLCACGARKWPGSDHCRRCAAQLSAKFTDREGLQRKLAELDHNYRAVGRHYGVTDNMIRKYCRRLGIPLVHHKFRHKTRSGGSRTHDLAAPNGAFFH